MPPLGAATVQPWWVHVAETPWTAPDTSLVRTMPFSTMPAGVTLAAATSALLPPLPPPAPYPFAPDVDDADDAALLFRATTKPTTAAAADMAAPVSTERRVSGCTLTFCSSCEREPRPGEEPQCGRQPQQHDAGDDEATEHG